MRNLSTLPLLCRLFDGIRGDDLGQLLGCLAARTVSLAKDEPLFLAGDKADRFAVVVSGSLAVSAYDAEGRRSIIKRVGPMEVAAAAQAVSRDTFDVSVEAETESEVLVLDSERVLSPCRSACPCHLRLMRNLSTVLAAKTLALNEKIGVLSHRTIAERLMAYLSGVAERCGSREFDIPFDRQALADYLCVDRSALSAEIGRLARAGHIAAHKNHFTVAFFEKKEYHYVRQLGKPHHE